MGQCTSVCLEFLSQGKTCFAINFFRLISPQGVEFMCELLGTLVGVEPADGAACYILRYDYY